MALLSALELERCSLSKQLIEQNKLLSAEREKANQAQDALCKNKNRSAKTEAKLSK